MGNFLEIRKICATELRSKVSFYLPFTTFQNEEEFENHCKIIQETAEWGDQLEVISISNAIQRKIIVHMSESPDQIYGDYPEEIHLAFIRDYSIAGSHYNPVLPKPS